MNSYDPVAIRENLVTLLRAQYLGPAAGRDEATLGRPDRSYLVGTLYPQGPSADRLDGDALGTDSHDEELDEPIELANAWHPASAAISFLHDATTLRCEVRAGTYEKKSSDSDGSGTDRWVRRDWQEDDVEFHAHGPAEDNKVSLFEDRARLVCAWRAAGDRWLVTVALENMARHDETEAPPPTEKCLFQVQVDCHTEGGRVLPYPSSSDLSEDPEDQDLRLLYRERQVFGVGHGCSVDWKQDPDGVVRTVSTEMLPMTVVPDVKATGGEADVLRLAHLADETVATEALCDELSAFIGTYESWVVEQGQDAEAMGASDRNRHMPAATRLLGRMDRAVGRMQQGVELLRNEPIALLAFQLANAAMYEQILQTRHVRTEPGKRGKQLAPREPSKEPKWRPFQLGFQLLSLASTADERHEDRQTVDLIWFPTGGGKTEAYLGLAAFEMIRRRLVGGLRGGGTAVLTRYTLRLLTSQQFQRAATLICALERLREERSELRETPPFSIGLWVGGETTPNDFKTAHALAVALRKAQVPENPFQIQVCPWCGTPVVPERKQQSPAYGFRTTRNSFELFCPHEKCPFHDLLPVSVVDEQMFREPPTLLIATVDKFARLPWLKDAGALLGRTSVPYDAPSLVIQDELHLLSGPLGTVVALYEAAIQSLISWGGSAPKVVASTATIRSADHQVRSLFGAPVELFPPSGLSADDSFFARTDRDSPGRLYIGLMPQAHTQAFATVLSCVALLQGPMALELEGEALDAYWTLVAYHSSLRELGRTVTIARDDVESMLKIRSKEGVAFRSIRRDGVVELTSNISASQLPQILTRLEQSVGHVDAVDLVATTNMLSVGIDISRLGMMLMNGQPKTTSEYIQATSRVGRSTVPGLVITLLRAGKPRDRSHYESFRSYHESLYRHVEPTSVTPWSLASRERSLRAALVLLVRHGVGLRDNGAAGDFSRDDPAVKNAVARLVAAARIADPDEADHTERELLRFTREWQERAERAVTQGERLHYQSRDNPALLKDFGEQGEGWPTMHSMRSVDRQVRVLAVGETRA